MEKIGEEINTQEERSRGVRVMVRATVKIYMIIAIVIHKIVRKT